MDFVSGSIIDGDGSVHVRKRVVSPVSHGLVQLDHSDQDEKPPSTETVEDLIEIFEQEIILPIHRVIIANRLLMLVDICVRSYLQPKKVVSVPSQTIPG